MSDNNTKDLYNDYVTLWSKYVLTGDYNLISKELEALAELGQIDAVEKYLVNNGVGNPMIDYRARTHKVDGYQADFVKGIYKTKRHTEAYEKLFNRALEVYKNYKIIEDSPVSRYFGGAVYTEQQEQLMLKLRKKINLYFSLLRKVDGHCFVAKKKIDEELNESKDALLIHNKAKIVNFISNLALLPKTKEKYQQECKKLEKEAANKLYKEYKNFVKSKKEVDPSVALALAEHYINSKNANNQIIAKALLSNYSDRELSERLKEYMTRKEKENTNNNNSSVVSNKTGDEQVK